MHEQMFCDKGDIGAGMYFLFEFRFDKKHVHHTVHLPHEMQAKCRYELLIF